LYYCDRMAFEEFEEKDIVSKYPQQLTNDGKWYYVHWYHPVDQKYIPFVLPDTRFFPPEEMANVIMMPSMKKVLKPKPTE
ncbi:unnamed protein product, partial [marine sediment metagenome]